MEHFHKITLPFTQNVFEELSTTTKFETTGKGRLGNHLVHIQNGEIPLVRTTTQYTIPAHDFAPIHHQITQLINENISEEVNFNNALIEVYDINYRKMKYHSDQCLDLDQNSYIGIFSCYENTDTLSKQFIRKLKIQNKETGEESEIELTHNSVVLFSVPTNTKFLHKIVLENIPKNNLPTSDNRWLGITFRTSKTFIHFKDGFPYFSNGDSLILAEEDTRKKFYVLRGEENKSMDFIYPTIPYTISPSDLLLPKK
jgi:hypothetical protein